MTKRRLEVTVRPTRREDFAGIVELCGLVYPESPPWTHDHLVSHLQVFPEGQLVAVDTDDRIVGMAASLMVRWDDYNMNTTWRDMTAAGSFRNHDPAGRTLYGAEVMVRPQLQGHGIGKRLYQARRDLVRALRLLRIRAGARLRGFKQHVDHLTAEEYVRAVVRRELKDPTLTFQLRQRFRVLAVVPNYLRHDPDSLGYAAVIEWINHEVAKRGDYAGRDDQFGHSRKDPPSASP